MLLAGDTISKITNPDDRATRLIFGDAGTASIISDSADKINVAHDKIPFAAGTTGNTSSASIPLLLCQNRYENLQKVMLCGFGVGLACASCIADLFDTKILDVINYGSSNI